MIRTIYMLECITEDGNLLVRRFFANQKAAERVKKIYEKHSTKPLFVVISPVKKRDFSFICEKDVER